MSSIITQRDGRVGIIKLNRPESKNSLNQPALEEILNQCFEFDRDDSIGAIVILGSPDVFCAGGDLQEMEEYTSAQAFVSDIFDFSERIAQVRKPLIAGVSGYALGGGFELALACDLVVVSTTATLGLPETKLGIIPGMGGTQRLTRAVGKALAMEVCLAGRFLSATEAVDLGLASRIVEPEAIEEAALELAQTIAERPMVSIMMTKESVLYAYESFLSGGLRHERRLLDNLFATEDKREGVRAFLEKRSPNYSHR